MTIRTSNPGYAMPGTNQQRGGVYGQGPNASELGLQNFMMRLDQGRSPQSRPGLDGLLEKLNLDPNQEHYSQYDLA